MVNPDIGSGDGDAFEGLSSVPMSEHGVSASMAHSTLPSTNELQVTEIGTNTLIQQQTGESDGPQHRSSNGVEITRNPSDDTSGNQFMSEPSISEDETDRIRAPHRSSIGLRPSPVSLTHSPGNTSLSSWDTSPKLNVQVQFTSSSKPGPSLPSVTVENHGGEQRIRVHPLIPRYSAVTGGSRSQHNDSSSLEGTNSQGALNPPQNQTIMSDRSGPSSINMALSESEDEDIPLTENDRGTAQTTLSNSMQQQRPAPTRRAAGRQHVHRRTRSGDAAAASLATGGEDWKGMTKDNIPMPGMFDTDDDGSPAPTRSKKINSAPPAQQQVAERLPRQNIAANTVGEQNLSQERPSREVVHHNMTPFLPPSSPRTIYGTVPIGPDLQNLVYATGLQHPQLYVDPDHPMVSYPQGWIPPSPRLYARGSYWDYAHGSVGSFSPRSSYMNERVASFPQVEDVEQETDSDFTGPDTAPLQGQLDRDPLQEEQSDPTLYPIYTPGSESPFANLGRKSSYKAPRSSFMPTGLTEEDIQKYPTYVCPRCKTRQREFFTTSDAPQALTEPSNYLAFYFGVYVLASLFIFGLEEGWKPLDCVYFAVITLTTAGLGDFVPTTDANKIICSIFIYFGVACIGLLLGSYIASMQDDRAYRVAKKKQIDSCPNCARLATMKEAAESRRLRETTLNGGPPNEDFKGINRSNDLMHLSLRKFHQPEVHNAVYIPRHQKRNEDESSTRPVSRSTRHGSDDSHSMRGEHMPPINERTTLDVEPASIIESTTVPPPPPIVPAYTSVSPSGASPHMLGSPMTRQILGRQKHTRHHSFDIGNVAWNPKTRKYSEDLAAAQTPPQMQEKISLLNPPTSAPNQGTQVPFPGSGPGIDSLRGSAFVFDEDNVSDTDDSDADSDGDSSDTTATIDDIVDEKLYKIKAAKYVFLTLRQALINSMVIIAVGCAGFVLTERFGVIDSWYFTTVLLTTTGYGDITPITNGGKLFATVYILVAGSVLINNMSMISMIPLELRRRRIERAVLTQFGDQLDDAALRELATGPLIQRLSLSANRADGLDECTREMFSLAMLVRLGKVTEDDIRETFAVFRRLDVNDEGVLNSKTIIAGMIQKRRSSMHNLRQQRARSEPPLATVSRSSAETGGGQALQYWEMPPVPLTTPEAYHTSDGGMAQVMVGSFDRETSDPFLAPSGPYTTNIPVPNETSSLLQH